MNSFFEQGEELFHQEDYKGAFEVFKRLSEDISTSSQDMSDALNMMGVVLNIEPSLAVHNEFDESISYFKQSLQHNPSNLGALLNIVENFGNSYGQHADFELFDFCYTNLKKMVDELSVLDIEMIENKYLIYKEMKSSN